NNSFRIVKLSFQKKVIKRMNTMFGNSSSYSCINCGTRHNEISNGFLHMIQISILIMTYHLDQNRSPRKKAHTTSYTRSSKSRTGDSPFSTKTLKVRYFTHIQLTHAA
ncbi:MAG TPA: hypothetical protein VE223_01120, partial [Nitrososphaeraceae archaeon]|nr:hypothetical protein [Nitrososphaeraceae archaeon]